MELSSEEDPLGKILLLQWTLEAIANFIPVFGSVSLPLIAAGCFNYLLFFFLDLDNSEYGI